MCDNPSEFLPSLSRISLYTILNSEISVPLKKLETWLLPKDAYVNGTSNALVHYTSSNNDFERTYARGWLLRLMAMSDDEPVLEEAGNLIAILSGVLRTPVRPHKYEFASPEGPVKITIQDSPMHDVDATGFCTWSSSRLLASWMLRDPHFLCADLHVQQTSNAMQVKVLELGSGTGLAGIAACMALHQADQPAQVTFSDYDEKTLASLRANVTSNLGTLIDGYLDVNLRKLKWEDEEAFSKEAFDIIIGADIIYEREHGMAVVGVVQRLLSRRKGSTFHLAIPIRPTHEDDVSNLETLLEGNGSGYEQLVIKERIDVEAEEGQPYPHRYYRIGWLE